MILSAPLASVLFYGIQHLRTRPTQWNKLDLRRLGLSMPAENALRKRFLVGLRYPLPVLLASGVDQKYVVIAHLLRQESP